MLAYHLTYVFGAQESADLRRLFNKSFLAAEILCGLTMNASNRHFLIPAKANTCREVIQGTADGARARLATRIQRSVRFCANSGMRGRSELSTRMHANPR
jgi:hypothetical protein